MNVLSFRSTPQTVVFYIKHMQAKTMCWKRLGGTQRVRGYVQRIESPEPGIHLVYMNIEEFDGGFDRQRLPVGYSYGPLPTFKFGDPRNQRVVFTCTEDQVKLYPVGKRMRVDASITEVGKLEGIVIKTQLEKNQHHWKVTVECPPQEDRLHFVRPELERLPKGYIRNGQGAMLRTNRYLAREWARILQQERYPRFYDVPGVGKFYGLVTEVKEVDAPTSGTEFEVTFLGLDVDHHTTTRESYSRRLLEQMSKSLGVPYDILTFDPQLTKLSVGPLAKEYATFHQCDEYMADILKQKEQTMKIFDAVVVKVDEKGTPTEIAKVVPPFLAKDEASAKTAIMVDYATENKIAGKDLTGISVLVRPFQVGY